MQIVIDVSDEDYKRIKDTPDAFNSLTSRAYKSIKDGKPLPKGHGRLFDERDIVNGNYEVIGNRIYELEPIIEADKKVENDKLSD